MDIDDDVLSAVVAQLSALAARRAACVCKHWWRVVEGGPREARALSCLVTSADTNEIVMLDGRGRVAQRIKAMPPPKRRRTHGSSSTTTRSWSNLRDAYNWPTCLAFGPRGELYISQYRVQGLLQFNRSFDGFQYQRTLVTGPRFGSPEGIVCAHNSLYLVSADHSTITRLAMDGHVLDETVAFTPGAFTPVAFTPTLDDNFVYWGMCLGPDGHLYVASHVSDDSDYLRPTQQDTGGVLCQRLTPTGEFAGRTHCVAGYPLQISHPLGIPKGDQAFNRPSDPVFCDHGMLHVSSFATTPAARETGMRRVVYKVDLHASLPALRPLLQSRCLGWLEASSEKQLLRNAWGISFANGEMLVCCQSAEGDEESPVVRLPSCGCAAVPARPAGCFDGVRGVPPFRPKGINCGVATPFGGAASNIKRANYITHLGAAVQSGGWL